MNKDKIKVLLNGSNGRMGHEVIKAARDFENIEIIAGVDRDTENGECEFPIFSNITNINVMPDIIIDFSVPDASMKILEFAKENNIPLLQQVFLMNKWKI